MSGLIRLLSGWVLLVGVVIDLFAIRAMVRVGNLSRQLIVEAADSRAVP